MNLGLTPPLYPTQPRSMAHWPFSHLTSKPKDRMNLCQLWLQDVEDMQSCWWRSSCFPHLSPEHFLSCAVWVQGSSPWVPGMGGIWPSFRFKVTIPLWFPLKLQGHFTWHFALICGQKLIWRKTLKLLIIVGVWKQLRFKSFSITKILCKKKNIHTYTHTNLNWVWWLRLVMLALKWARQDHHKLKASLGYIGVLGQAEQQSNMFSQR